MCCVLGAVVGRMSWLTRAGFAFLGVTVVGEVKGCVWWRSCLLCVVLQIVPCLWYSLQALKVFLPHKTLCSILDQKLTFPFLVLHLPSNGEDTL